MRGVRGLRNQAVAIVARPGARVTTAQVWVRVGSAHELPGEHGAAHLVEHLIARTLLREVQALGAVVHASTSRARTMFGVTCLPGHLPRVIGALGDAVADPTWDETALRTERRLVLQELAWRSQAPAWRFQEALLSRLWAGSSLAHPTLGNALSVARLDLARLRAFHASRYRAHPARWVLAGAVTPARARAWTGLSVAVPITAAPIPLAPRFDSPVALGTPAGLCGVAWRHRTGSVNTGAFLGVVRALLPGGTRLTQVDGPGHPALVLSWTRGWDSTGPAGRLRQVLGPLLRFRDEEGLERARERLRLQHGASLEDVEEAATLVGEQWRTPRALVGEQAFGEALRQVRPRHVRAFARAALALAGRVEVDAEVAG